MQRLNKSLNHYHPLSLSTKHCKVNMGLREKEHPLIYSNQFQTISVIPKLNSWINPTIKINPMSSMKIGKRK